MASSSALPAYRFQVRPAMLACLGAVSTSRQQRDTVAAGLGIRVSALDKLVKVHSDGQCDLYKPKPIGRTVPLSHPLHRWARPVTAAGHSGAGGCHKKSPGRLARLSDDR